jgi:hypothetical protein
MTPLEEILLQSAGGSSTQQPPTRQTMATCSVNSVNVSWLCPFVLMVILGVLPFI